MEVTKEGMKQERKERQKEEEGRGKLGKDFLHHVSPFLANYLKRTEKKNQRIVKWRAAPFYILERNF
jgi:hypothetical protein